MSELTKDVHTEHCCLRHGCKYGDLDCPVYLQTKVQSHPCESCQHDDNDVTIKDIYVGEGSQGPNSVVIHLSDNHRVTLTDAFLTKMVTAIHKAEHIANKAAQEARIKRQLTEPKVPCPGLGYWACGNPKPESAGVCEKCNREFAEDPDAYK